MISAEFPVDLIVDRVTSLLKKYDEKIVENRERTIERIMSTRKRYWLFGPLPDRARAEKIYRNDDVLMWRAEGTYRGSVSALRKIETVALAAQSAGTETITLGHDEIDLLRLSSSSPAGEQD